MFSRYLVLYLVLSTLVMEVQGGKTVLSTCFGKLVPAVIKCFGARIFGLNMNKVKHIMIARHYLDKLDPGEIVYEVITVVASNLPYKKYVDIMLVSGKIIRITVKILADGVGIGTGYAIEKIADAIEKQC
ncbi:unnamed protein product (macronuclear) [Paramecium tetraurelia]|uniref:Uncharacterized protein n=1 Tax=Paramecium tetraurelia TaxID=5888 RepID=A0BED9_PARTE|nr:uncharacterized protein GSPATT00027939001 [Paramecium tetraurelia]CAK56906.1 unnamed protein product [Paramecium tetraurelia]|eukprot:XP_001424304.1 hypothetical protein (macronuclear) [Paramecium tetraurelia strain d4-2]